MPCKKNKRKIRKRRQASYSMNQPLRLVNDATKGVIAVGTLGIVANTVTKIAKP
jgi:hypothetical protein